MREYYSSISVNYKAFVDLYGMQETSIGIECETETGGKFNNFFQIKPQDVNCDIEQIATSG